MYMIHVQIMCSAPNINTVLLTGPEVNIDEDIDQEDSEQIQEFSKSDHWFEQHPLDWSSWKDKRRFEIQGHPKNGTKPKVTLRCKISADACTEVAMQDMHGLVKTGFRQWIDWKLVDTSLYIYRRHLGEQWM